MDDTNRIEMIDEDGNTLIFEHLLTFEADDDFFVAFTPIAKTDEYDVGDVLIMRIEEDGDDDVFIPIESEEELDELWNIFQELYYNENDDEEGESN